jgi:hypothetical protein
MTKFAAFALLLIGTAGIAGATVVPEIDPASGGSALALLTGALLVIRARRNK